jgi:GDP-4-dehydro-6-deoxy-D-mannose reductase
VRAVVTGGTGFVGRHLAAHLRDCGDDVTVLDARSAANSDSDRAAPVDVTDARAVHAAVLAAAPAVVYHLAALSHVGDSWTAGDRLTRVNVDGTRNVLAACVAAGGARVIVIGSADEYGVVGADDLPLRETTPRRPITPYGVSKVAAEAAALEAFRSDALPVVCVRAFNHTGPGQASTFLVPGLAARIAAAERAGDDEIVVGNLDPVRDFSDVRDVVRAYRLLAEHGEPGEAYNVCSGQGHSVAELVDSLLARASRALTARVDPALARPVDVPVLVGDPTKLGAATGWQPTYDIRDTLAEMLDAARADVRTA